MNRLILIGNGFDLAHGMKTTYVDFIVWYIKQMLIKTIEIGVIEDVLISIEENPIYQDYIKGTPELFDSWVDTCYERGFDLTKLGIPRTSPKGGNHIYPFAIKVKSRLLQKLLNTCGTKRWVDVEATFYNTLLEILKNYTDDEEKEKKLIELNEQMKVLIQQLETYLSSLEPPKHNSEYINILKDYIYKHELEPLKNTVVGYALNDELASNTLILNFNYTSTVELYITAADEVRENPFTVNYIHGKLNSKDNPIIFGFGDEMDKVYTEIEEEKANGYFEYMKSFWYFKSSNYRNLVRFINSNDYQTVILGHSCGLSDRTMLNMVLEHENCRSIKIYYHYKHGIDNYTTTTQEISRHFKNKAIMRNRVVEKNKSKVMPQVRS